MKDRASLLLFGSLLFILLLTLCLAGERLAPHDPLAVDLMHRLAAPSAWPCSALPCWVRG